MGVKFTLETEKAIAAIVFFASKQLQDLTKGKICKLIFLADKSHLVRFGRPVTGDRICALKDGPVPSAILNMLNALVDEQASAEPMLLERIVLDRRFVNPYFSAKEFDLAEFFSDSDIEALEDTIQRYGDKSFSELRRLTHDMAAYTNAWEQRRHNAPEMAFEDFFEDDEQAVQGAKEEMLENCKLESAFACSTDN